MPSRRRRAGAPRKSRKRCAAMSSASSTTAARRPSTGSTSMISGPDMRTRRLVLAGFLVLATAPPVGAQAGWGLPQLMATLAHVKSASAQFVERKTLRVLEAPLVSSGTLLYVAPDQVEKITVLPERERIAISGDKLTIEGGTSDRPRTLSLANAPEIAAFVESIRATLAGDLPALDRFYRVELAGGP